MPKSPIRREVVLGEDPQGEHVPGIERQPEHTPALDVLVARPWGLATPSGQVAQLRRQINHGHHPFDPSRVVA